MCHFTLTGSDSESPAAKRHKPDPVEHQLVEQQPLTTVNSLVDVHQKQLAGFAVDVCRVFVRPESVAMWSAIEDAVASGKNLRVSGPPGTGKSTEAWAWAMWKAQHTKKKVVWFHYAKTRATKVVIDGASMKVFTGHSAKIADIENSEGDFLIVDGVMEKDSIEITRDCSAWRGFGASRTFVTVSSVSVSPATEQDQEAHLTGHTVPSWTLEQYELACNDDDFFNSVKAKLCNGDEGMERDDLIIAKYFFAGGSARWMFEFTLVDLKRDFDIHFNKVQNYRAVFGVVGGEKSTDAVNHLRGLTITHDGTMAYFFISQYATNRLAERCGNDADRQFILDGYKKADETGNPSFRGWIFEFDVDYQLKEAKRTEKSLTISIRPNKEQEQDEEEEHQQQVWRVDEYITFKDRAGLLAKVMTLSANQVLWAKPALWCQKAFDFLYFQRDGAKLIMVAVNASHAKKHAVLLQELNSFGTYFSTNECAIFSMLFHFVVPSGEEFAIGKVAGQLNDWRWEQTKEGMIANDRIAVVELACTKQM
jgi:hypothetical protein